MPRCNSLINACNGPVFCGNLGVGEEGALLKQFNSAIYICHDNKKCAQIKAQLDALGKNAVVVDEFVKPFTLSKFQSKGSTNDLLIALYELAAQNTILISTPKILTTKVINLNDYKAQIIELGVGTDYDISELEKQLITLGYTKVDSVTEKGEFSRRGDVVDVFSINAQNPIRIDFFDTQIEDIYQFDFLSYEKLEKLDSAKIIPAKFVLQNLNEILNSIQKLKSNNELLINLCSAIERGEDVPLEFLAPFSKQITTFANFNLPIIISNELSTGNLINKELCEYIENIQDIFAIKKVEKLYKESQNFKNLNDFYAKSYKNLVFFDNFEDKTLDLYKRIKTITGADMQTQNFATVKFPSLLQNLGEIKRLYAYADKKIYLCLESETTLLSIKKILEQTNINFTQNKNGKGIILTTLNIPYNICFYNDDIFYIGSTNFAHKKEFVSKSKQTVKYLPKAGEYVVHSVHGIGRCEGTITMQVGGVDKEFFKLSYRGGDVLYVPYENADSLSLYMAEAGSVNLNKLGGKEFASEKLKAIKSIEDMSGELLTLYAKRKATKGHKYPEDDYLYTEFENAFEHTETADQMQAIQDVKNDMISGKVMDRLICGDVGFGKTEVAMRALFKAVEDGKQVAILAPTTILSLQHFMTAQKRTEKFGVKVEMLNRFKTAKQQKQILEDLKSGKINVICGTHRLLSKDIVFDDLGLLVLDEEQRFGVKAKEHIKQLKNSVDVLTLSATPIPRTLSMSLMAIRDISIINTPPVDRLPVKTYVLAFDLNHIAQIINYEIKRGGQVLVVYNNIERIYKLKDNLQTAVNNPDAIFDVAHGQMGETELENAVKRLYDRVTNVFVSTTLIENGVDLPKANTLIVVDSDHLGLSQMYQLRGRVGRNTEQAYAYFTFDKGKILTEEATNRLQAIAENTELGSGFKIAMRDLQIRGAGELLGKVQHGHIVKIGYDMYMKLLNETLRKMRGEKVSLEREIKLDIALDSKIPLDFVSDEAERLKIVSKISNITDKNSARNVLNELLAQFGKLPKEIYNLTNIALLKANAVKNGVKHIVLNNNKMWVVFYNDVDMQKLIAKVNQFSHLKFENGALPTISLSPREFSVQTAISHLTQFFAAN